MSKYVQNKAQNKLPRVSVGEAECDGGVASSVVEVAHNSTHTEVGEDGAEEEEDDNEEEEEEEEEEEDDDNEEDQENQEQDEEWGGEEWEDLEAFDLFEALRLPRPAAHSGSSGLNVSRVRSAYHREVWKYHPRYGTAAECESERELEQRLRRITVSYLTLKDRARLRIYAQHGWVGLKRSETYSEHSVFEECPYEVYDRFFEGVDPDDREYLLLNGNAHLSEEEEASGEEVSREEGKKAGDVEETVCSVSDGDVSDNDDEVVLSGSALASSRARLKSDVAQVAGPVLPRMEVGVSSAGVGAQALLAQVSGGIVVSEARATKDKCVSRGNDGESVCRVVKRGARGIGDAQAKRARVSVIEAECDGGVASSAVEAAHNSTHAEVGEDGVEDHEDLEGEGRFEVGDSTGVHGSESIVRTLNSDSSCATPSPSNSAQGYLQTKNLLILHNYLISMKLLHSADRLRIEAQLDSRTHDLMGQCLDIMRPPPVARSEELLQFVSAAEVIKMYRFDPATNKCM